MRLAQRRDWRADQNRHLVLSSPPAWIATTVACCGIAIANGAAVQLRRELRHLEFEVRLFKSLNAYVA
jgi:hypothetical protein